MFKSSRHTQLSSGKMQSDPLIFARTDKDDSPAIVRLHAATVGTSRLVTAQINITMQQNCPVGYSLQDDKSEGQTCLVCVATVHSKIHGSQPSFSVHETCKFNFCNILFVSKEIIVSSLRAMCEMIQCWSILLLTLSSTELKRKTTCRIFFPCWRHLVDAKHLFVDMDIAHAEYVLCWRFAGGHTAICDATFPYVRRPY